MLQSMIEILVAYDDSAPAKAALDAAAAEARDRRAKLAVLAVLELPVSPNEPRAYGTMGDGPSASGPYVAPPEIEAVLDAAKQRLAPTGVHATYIWAAGPPAEVIVEASEARNVALVVLGQGHHGMLGRFFGSDIAHEVEAHLGRQVLAVEGDDSAS